jgi:hypothetical protein
VYDGLTLAYSTMGDLPMAVRAMEAKAVTDNFQMPMMFAIRGLYRKMPDGLCAFTPGGYSIWKAVRA